MAKSRLARNRYWLGLGILAIIGLGLASRRFPLFPAILWKYPGDALWALMVYLGWGFIFTEASAIRLAAFALGTSFAVEFSQLYQAPWIDAIRSTTAGHLVLGAGFLWIDLIAYTTGVAVGMVLDFSLTVVKRRHAP